MFHTAVSVTVQALAAKELTGKQYDQTRTHETNKYVELPAPTLKDPKRTKRVQVLGLTEEYRVQARLDGQPDIRIPHMLRLVNYADGGLGMVLVALDASLPVTGHVQGRVPNVASASTGYRAAIQLYAVVEVLVRRSGNDVTFGPYTVPELRVYVSRLNFSNDLLDAGHRLVRRFINYELDRNEDRLRRSANESLEKAISSQEVRIPLLGYLASP